MTYSELIDLMIYPIKKAVTLLAQLSISSGTVLGLLGTGIILTMIFGFFFHRDITSFRGDGYSSEQKEKEDKAAKRSAKKNK